jgi:hypothetical protein
VARQGHFGGHLAFPGPMISLRTIEVPLLTSLGRSRTMAKLKVCWGSDLALAQETARKTNKPILLDFFHPG